MNFLKILKSKKAIFGLVVAVAGASAFIFGGDNGKQILTVERGDIVQEVAATGKVKPNQSVDLGFDRSGRVSQVLVEVGSSVFAGDLLATLEVSDVNADVAKAKSVLEEETIKLRELKSTSPASYKDAAQNLEAAERKAFVAADNAVRNKIDQFFKTPTSKPEFEVSFTDGNFVHYFDVSNDVKLNLNNQRVYVGQILTKWSAELPKVNSSNASFFAEGTLSYLNSVADFLDQVADAINAFTPAEYAYETTVNTYKTTVSSARTEVSDAIKELVAAKDKLNSAPTLNEAGQFESVLAQEAKVSQARAALTSLEAVLGKAMIRAPFGGVVTVQDAKVGAAVNAGENLISMTSNQDVYIEANISEINIGKLKEGNPVSVKFDAFPGEEFEGFVSFIEPGDVLIEGVVNYKIRVDFGKVERLEDGTIAWKYDGVDPRIKNGLTADLKIETSKTSDAVVLPLYAVSREDGKSFVNKVIDGKIEKTEVNLGREGSDGVAEVLDGLNVGDNVAF